MRNPSARRPSASSYRTRLPSGSATTRPHPRRHERWLLVFALPSSSRRANSAGYAGPSNNSIKIRRRESSARARPSRFNADSSTRCTVSITTTTAQQWLYHRRLRRQRDSPTRPAQNIIGQPPSNPSAIGTTVLGRSSHTHHAICATRCHPTPVRWHACRQRRTASEPTREPASRSLRRRPSVIAEGDRVTERLRGKNAPTYVMR